MQLFYTPDIAYSPANGAGGTYLLSEEESRHCMKVLRLREGALVQLTDGKGRLFSARLVETGSKRCLLEITGMEVDYGKRPYRLHVAIAPTKNTDRLEWFLEKATEAGIDEITPIICARSERRVLRTDRLIRRITAAMKQSLHAYHPVLNEAIPFGEFVGGQASPKAGNQRTPAAGGSRTAALKLIAHCATGPKRCLGDDGNPPRDVLALIGPEGDFTPAEIELALDSGFSGLDLGNSRLRTETAGLAVCFEMRFLNR